MAASKKNMEDGQENKNMTNVSDFASQVCSKDGQSFEDLVPCFDFNESSDDEYIDIEVGSAMFWEAASRKLNTQRTESREFEFDAKVMEDLDLADSPADELFYKGRLLPLHLPPRIQMVEKLLASEKSPYETRMTIMGKEAQNKSVLNMDSRNLQEKNLGRRLIDRGLDMGSKDSVFLTPYESCEATPYDSCEASQELCPDLYKENFMTSASMNQAEVEAASSESKEKNNRLNMIRKAKKLLEFRETSLALKLKASRAYVKSLFSKTTSNKDRTASNQRDLLHNTTDDPDHNMVSRGCMNRYTKVLKVPSSANGDIGIQREGYKVAVAVAKSLHKENSPMIEDVSRRKSFSDGFSLMTVAESHNSNSLCSSNRVSTSVDGVVLKRSSSAYTDMENAIQGAIAHCKQSAHLASNNSITDPSNSTSKFQIPTSNGEGYTNGYVMSTRSGSRIGVCDQPQTPGLCRG